MKNEELTKKLLSPSKNSRLEKFGRYLTFACLSLIVVIVAMILIFVAQKGLSTFFVNGVNVFDFLFGGVWNPSGKSRPIVSRITLGPAKPIKAPGSAMMISAVIAKEAVIPPNVGFVR